MIGRPDRDPLDDSSVERTVLLRRLETLLCLVLVLIATTLAVYHYNKFYQCVKVMMVTGPLQDARTADLYYWNLHGIWPHETQAALDFIGADSICDKRFRTTIEDGVIQVQGLKGNLSGEVVSIHPVTPRADLLGPVHWRFGPDHLDPHLLVQGPDRTTLPQGQILSGLQ